ncbi:alpha/beta fold hydrolase [Marinobacter persicus]|jgi:pimeloyl-ACP methyl ester carboxylesterase|uniref:Alpha-beta hydrolase superfamily lysophospholipase n=2 Tax=Marinobacter persicus TaxID=930118 RepID=A0A1I3T7M8_9GAMM|nr:alpha/beta hydrolase [Marinobacter persicus]PPK51208.1 alpha-beta hydrolase superfamily lysophospholipase [Marinobacter persicus]PPK54477.1 alpha-beta hydrolase superfamily lysophospholipase [Marinobacter persicus]PPK57803.1 alpha-beta hydrolase superfamily lysophospholipase [Marinobacter persicus]SFJ66985.1 Lysophospholipase, alpha-beta hydrolase superfamily [Marinobacter persicus]GHD40153.1 alpha/beta hydrolase [Marinobacter persicus]
MGIKHNTPERDEFRATDGADIALWRWPQSKARPTLHWAHATGFHGRLYRPLLDELATDVNVLAWDMRGHGASAGAANVSTFRGWETYYRDMTALLDSQDEPVWLAGHSIGATTSIMAAARRPDKVLGLILAEPVIMDPVQGLKLWGAKLLRQSHRLSLAAGAARRRRVFDSHAAALDNYRGRGGFKTWPEAWLEAYVQHAFVPQGDQVQLACSPEWESTTFAHTEHNPWPGIRQLRCPVIALAAEHGSTFSPAAQKRLQTLLPSADVRVVAGTTHFLPMEQNNTVRDAILQLALSGWRGN